MANASGVNARMYAQRAYSIVAPAIADALKEPGEGKQVDPSLLKFTGAYSYQPWGGETAVLVWKGELAMVSFPTEKPLDNITRLKHISGNTFKRIRDNDELGEEIVFELGVDGEVARLRRHSNVFPKVR